MITPLTLALRPLSERGPRMWPDHGETLGIELERAADAYMERLGGEEMLGTYSPRIACARIAATFLTLAAEAYQHGADASIGHGRTARYEERARQLNARAASIMAAAG